MKRVFAAALPSALFCALPAPALAGNIAKCEIVIMQHIADEAGGGMEVASFRPAGDFLQGVYDTETELVRNVDGFPVRAVMCVRRDLMPDEDDYVILATGIPLAISQNFDSTESDSLTLFFHDGEFRYKYVSAEDMPDAMQETLEARLADFSAREHGLASADDTDDTSEKDMAEESGDD